jgi:hypothetical protein
LRAIVLGSAVSQVVPVDDFIKRKNEQIYNPSPVIVPLVTALVYDLSKYNSLGATTFTLPTFYTRDRISAGTDVVNKAGQTVVFTGGPGFDDASAATLQLETTSTVTVDGYVFTTFTFDKATVVTSSNVGSKVDAGIAELTYASQSPSSVFANQQFLGFYRDNGWTNSLGIPIWDYGVSNTLFTAKLDTPITPVTIFDPATSFLNGGSLQNVVQNLRVATYLYGWDILDAMIQGATTGQDDAGRLRGAGARRRSSATAHRDTWSKPGCGEWWRSSATAGHRHCRQDAKKCHPRTDHDSSRTLGIHSARSA